MRRRRQQKLERKLQQFRSKDGGPDTGGTLKIYGEALCKDVPYKTLLLSIQDSSAYVVEEMLEKYGKDRAHSGAFCLVQVTTDPPQGRADKPASREYYLDDDECPLAILMEHHPSRGELRTLYGCLFNRSRFRVLDTLGKGVLQAPYRLTELDPFSIL